MLDTREDLELRALAAKQGWREILSIEDKRYPKRIPKHYISFAKGNKVLSVCKFGWACCESKPDEVVRRLNNIRYKSTLKELLIKES